MRECVLVLNQSLLQQNIHMILSPDSMLQRRENKCSSGHYGQTLQSKFYQATGNYVQKIKISFPWVHLQTILAFDVSFVFIKFIFTLSFSPALGLIHIVLNFVFWFVRNVKGVTLKYMQNFVSSRAAYKDVEHHHVAFPNYLKTSWCM